MEREKTEDPIWQPPPPFPEKICERRGENDGIDPGRGRGKGAFF